VENTIERIYADAMDALAKATDADAVNELSTQYLGRKGRITHFLRNISSLPADQRPQAGKRANEIKRSLEGEFKRHWPGWPKRSKGQRTASMSPSAGPCASQKDPLHPITQITNRICEHFFADGF
jgi:phenylalanyl-tRNA synthetase alpha chain